MFFNKYDVEIRKVVCFYSVFDSVLFSSLLVGLFLTNGIYFLGKYKFCFVIATIMVLEILKYIISASYFKPQDINLSKKYVEKNFSMTILNFFTKAKLRDVFNTVLVVCLMILVYFTVAILYGAEVFNKHEETFMFSYLLTVLTIFPVCINFGSNSVFALILGSKPINNLERLLYQNLYLTVLGAWLGAFVIPLDWDRPWQAWPIPCCIGALSGYTLSQLVEIVQLTSGWKRKNRKPLLFQK